MKTKTTAALTMLLCLFIPLTGQDLNDLIKKEVSGTVETAGMMYRELHQNPELSLQEFKTAAKMAMLLEDLGFEVTTDWRL